MPPNKGKEGWIAEDRDAFDDAVQRYQEALESLRGYVKTIAGIVDELVTPTVPTGWRSRRSPGPSLTLAAIASAMLATPYAPTAALNLRMLGIMASKIIAASTAMLGKVIAAGAGSMSVYFSGKAWMQSFNLEPTGLGKVDFTAARIKIGGLPPFQRPPARESRGSRSGSRRPGLRVAPPKKEIPEAYK